MNASAAVFRNPEEGLIIESFPLPRNLREGEALVEIDCCTLCGSDLHSIRGDREVPVPTILGHEIVGRLCELPGELHDLAGCPLAIGDRVSWSITAACGHCFFCREGLPQKCDRVFKYGHRALEERHPLSGGLASHCQLAPGTALLKVPDTLSSTVACPANCATATVAAALRVAGDCAGRVVVIHGAGLLGLTTAAMVRHAGAAQVMVCDPSEERRALALRFGATHTNLDPLADLTGGRGADLVFDLSGATEAMESSVSLLRTGGSLILVGAVFPGRALSLRADELVRKMLRVEGIHNYNPADLLAAFRFLEETAGKYPFASLVGREFPLAEINEAVAAALTGKSIRIAIRP